MSSSDHPVQHQSHDPIDILLTEYDELYSLVRFRMSSLDRRAPTITAGLVAFLAVISTLPRDVEMLALWFLPILLIGLLRTTGNHARSFEDVLSRLAEIERAVNALAGADLLLFQSQHPSRGRAVGGRTGEETVRSVLATCIAVLALCGYLAVRNGLGPPPVVFGYGAYLLAVLTLLLQYVRTLRTYRYRKLTTGGRYAANSQAADDAGFVQTG